MLSIHCLFKKKKTDDGIRFVELDETDSTNRYCMDHLCDGLLTDGQPMRMVVVSAEYQRDGRGQGINKWESERGANLLFSMYCRPSWLAARRQFVISECAALAIRDTLATFADGFSVKWPNDIYHHDRKICGILIENRLSAGRLKDCVVGVGLNVNQLHFVSDAPNPVSLRQITGREMDCKAIKHDIVRRFDERLKMGERGLYGAIAEDYTSCLYRLGGFHAYRDASSIFEAAIVEVEDDGQLILRDRDGRMRAYAFKEVEFIIS
ncbi:biotin--[acetyl-CoA-carboxylase] ligase [Hallella colorans]|uniref:biotin--[acetyl-CoA-carboxylase] ligase n=1 Tax=Hallella colorans TaxID=1703337 RepID=UPI0023F1C65A|nr:biotin--[acetyl-CoA-carboxylase] ligase [Hallella colorans]